MKLKHHDLEFELPNEWWAEARMEDFTPPSSAYAADPGNRKIFEVPIADVGAVRRNPGAGIFNDDADKGVPDELPAPLQIQLNFFPVRALQRPWLSRIRTLEDAFNKPELVTY
ncbi:MAG: hypothetical protein HQ492_12675 [Woeseiaceae bacterium]|nr:hypothetical protein [Woeseiaceae bacterium]